MVSDGFSLEKSSYDYIWKLTFSSCIIVVTIIGGFSSCLQIQHLYMDTKQQANPTTHQQD